MANHYVVSAEEFIQQYAQEGHFKAPRGNKLNAKSWATEAPLRMLLNNLDTDVAEDPSNLVVYGGRGKAARNYEALKEIIRVLLTMNEAETLLIQSGKPVGLLPTHPEAPRVIIANSNIVPHWANWDVFDELAKKGLMMYGQMTAGSWIYIGTQGIVQGTYETFAACAKQHFQGSLEGRLVVSGGLGGMGGAQPLAVTLNNGVFLGVDISKERISKRVANRYLDRMTEDYQEAIRAIRQAQDDKRPFSIGLVGEIGTTLRRLIADNVKIDVATDQTSAHDPVNGYVPSGLTLEEAELLRTTNPTTYRERSLASMAAHVDALLELKRRGTIVFDYGNNLRAFASEGGCKNAFDIKGFVPEYIRPLFCEGKGPFRWAALSGDPDDIAVTDTTLMQLFNDDKHLIHWLQQASRKIAFQGLPARICWLGLGDRVRAGLAFNALVREGKVKAPIVIGRDHLDSGSVASPYRETEGMKDGSDAVSDWPLLNAMVNTASGASWVSFHHGGGVGMGFSQHAGMVVIADGSERQERILQRVLHNDPALGVLRHADAGYKEAIECANDKDLWPYAKK